MGKKKIQNKELKSQSSATAACDSEGRRGLASRGRRERESEAHQRRPSLPCFASPRRSVREHIAGEGEGTCANLATPPGKTSSDVAAPTQEGELVGEEGEEEATEEEEKAPAKVKNQKLVAKEWTTEDEAADDELRCRAWMTEDTVAGDEL
uniref:Uncharacterized protein n=1 Tax=Oryza punctata TaxID=4537 RepID=A0A0E0MBH2_ORYPU